MRDAKPAFTRRTITPKCYPRIGYREAQGLSLRQSSPWTKHQRESKISQLPTLVNIVVASACPRRRGLELMHIPQRATERTSDFKERHNHEPSGAIESLETDVESASILLPSMLILYTNPLASPLAANRTSHLQRSFPTPQRPHSHLDCDDHPHIRLQFTKTYPYGKQRALHIITAVARDTVRLCSDTKAVGMTCWIACLQHAKPSRRVRPSDRCSDTEIALSSHSE